MEPAAQLQAVFGTDRSRTRDPWKTPWTNTQRSARRDDIRPAVVHQRLQVAHEEPRHAVLERPAEPDQAGAVDDELADEVDEVVEALDHEGLSAALDRRLGEILPQV